MSTGRPREFGPETAKNHDRRVAEGFFERYLSGEAVLDIGYRGGNPHAQPITETAIGIELDFPGYDGKHLPFPDESQDAVFASHTLEHIIDYKVVLADWYRVLKVGGYLIIAVPHKHLYERKAFPPSRFNHDHKRFYTPASLLVELAESLPLEGYRVRSLREIDDDFRYDLDPNEHAVGSYEIELVIQKIAIPHYSKLLLNAAHSEKVVRLYADLLKEATQMIGLEEPFGAEHARACLESLPLPPFVRIAKYLPESPEAVKIIKLLRELLAMKEFEEDFYLASNADIAQAVADGIIASGRSHFIEIGYFEGRPGVSRPDLFS